jgi:hypothetical protein
VSRPTFTDIKIVVGAPWQIRGRARRALSLAQVDFVTARCAFLNRATAHRWDALVLASCRLHREWSKERG